MGQNPRRPSQSNGENDSGDDAQQPQLFSLRTYEEAEQYCMNQLNAIQAKEQAEGKSPEEVERII